MSTSTWTPASMGEVLRQGRPARPGVRERALRAAGLEYAERRRLRRWWARAAPSLLLAAVTCAALAAAAFKAM